MQSTLNVALRRLALALATAVGFAMTAPAATAAEPSIQGVWRNPKNTVHLEIKPCGQNACGYVVWANASVQADARQRGFKDMVGMQLLRDFTPQKDGAWKGKVFVPSMNMTFSGTADFLNASALRAKGCALGAFFCKSQVWTRVGERQTASVSG